MQVILEYVHSNRPLFEGLQAFSAIINLLGWTAGAMLLYSAWRRNAIKTVSVGPISFQIEAAVTAAAAAARDWKAKLPQQKVDIPRIRQTVSKAFTPVAADNLTGKSILWVDDNPANNELAVRALRKLNLNVEQVRSTDQALSRLDQHHYDLVISDMGRGSDMRAGYSLLEAVRAQKGQLPFLIFAGSDTAAFRAEAATRGAQLSTNDVLELFDEIIKLLGN